MFRARGSIFTSPNPAILSNFMNSVDVPLGARAHAFELQAIDCKPGRCLLKGNLGRRPAESRTGTWRDSDDQNVSLRCCCLGAIEESTLDSIKGPKRCVGIIAVSFPPYLRRSVHAVQRSSNPFNRHRRQRVLFQLVSIPSLYRHLSVFLDSKKASWYILVCTHCRPCTHCGQSPA